MLTERTVHKVDVNRKYSTC